MFHTTLFTILEKDNSMPGEVTGRIKLNENHDVFKGHFPDNPVLPGVITIQIVLEFFANVMDKEFMVAEAKNIKFLKIIQPHINSELSITLKFVYLEEKKLKITATVFDGDDIFFKFSGIYQQE